MGNIAAYRKVSKPSKTGKVKEPKQTARKDVIGDVGQSLMDLVQKEPSRETNPKYDAMALLPTSIARVGDGEPTDWACNFSPVDPLLDYRFFIERLVATARVRGLLRPSLEDVTSRIRSPSGPVSP